MKAKTASMLVLMVVLLMGVNYFIDESDSKGISKDYAYCPCVMFCSPCPPKKDKK